MNGFARIVRQTLTIARRDFVATVFTPTFLIFLFAPIMIGSFGAIGGLGAHAAANAAGDHSRVVAIVTDKQADDMRTIDVRLRRLYREAEEAPPALQTVAPSSAAADQAPILLAEKGYDTAAVMSGPLDHPHVLYTPHASRAGGYLAELAEQTLRADRIGDAPLSTATREMVRAPAMRTRDASGAGFVAVFAMFLLTTLLAGQVVSGVAEEKGNKVIEILAAAVPLEAVFFGKLIGTFGVAMLFVLFWATLLGQASALVPASFATGLAALVPPMGMPLFILLFFAYFAMAYMLLGAVFLGVGAQATTVREIQLLSLPITIINVAMFGLASAAASAPDSTLAQVARVFPLSSPFAMAARAAQTAELWPNLAALAWQALWVSIFVVIGVRAFRRGVLQSGSGRGGFKALFGKA